MPLIANDRLVGVLQLHSEIENAYTADRVRLVERVSTQITGTAANAQLHLNAQNARMEAEAANTAKSEFSPSLENIERLAEVYGVTKARQLGAAASGESGTQRCSVAVRGCVETGGPSSVESPEIAAVSLPHFILDVYPTAVVVVVRGDSLAVDGVRDGDLLVVDPGGALQLGGLCAVRVDGVLCASTFMSTERLVLRTTSGRSKVLAPSDVEIVGSAVWHIRRM